MSTLDTAITAIRSTQIRTFAELNELLNAAHGRLAEFKREFDLAKAEEALADFEHELEEARPITAEDRRQWARDDADEAWGEERRAA